MGGGGGLEIPERDFGGGLIFPSNFVLYSVNYSDYI